MRRLRIRRAPFQAISGWERFVSSLTQVGSLAEGFEEASEREHSHPVNFQIVLRDSARELENLLAEPDHVTYTVEVVIPRR